MRSETCIGPRGDEDGCVSSSRRPARGPRTSWTCGTLRLSKPSWPWRASAESAENVRCRRALVGRETELTPLVAAHCTARRGEEVAVIANMPPGADSDRQATDGGPNPHLCAYLRLCNGEYDRQSMVAVSISSFRLSWPGGPAIARTSQPSLCPAPAFQHRVERRLDRDLDGPVDWPWYPLPIQREAVLEVCLKTASSRSRPSRSLGRIANHFPAI